MKTLGVLLFVGVALLVAGALAVPTVVTRMAEDRGVQIGRVSICGVGLCFKNVRRGPVMAMSGTLGTDRVLRLSGVHVGGAEGAERSGSLEAHAAAIGELDAAPLRAIKVEDLEVDGVPLPPLSGEVWPHRNLEGDGVTIVGDTVDAAFDSEVGPVRATVRKEGDTLVGAADCDCAVKVEALGGARFAAKVHAEGTLTGAHFVGTTTVGDVAADLDATRGEDGVVHAAFTLRDQPIAGVYTLFGGLVPELRDAQIRGTLSATGTVRWPEPDLVVKPTLRDFAVDGLVSPAYAVGSFSYPILDRNGVATTRTTGPADPAWLGLGGMGTLLPGAVIAAEDGRFRTHPGYDIDGMLDAAKANRAAGQIERGGSTLTQQLAKNLFLDGSRTYARKLRELLYAVELERELGKTRILEVYLNVVEFGPGVYGAREAATAFFSKSPAGLLPEEAAFLAAILRNPRTAWKTQYQRGTAYRGRVDWILDNMRDLPPEEREAAKAREIVLVPGG